MCLMYRENYRAHAPAVVAHFAQVFSTHDVLVMSLLRIVVLSVSLQLCLLVDSMQAVYIVIIVVVVMRLYSVQPALKV